MSHTISPSPKQVWFMLEAFHITFIWEQNIEEETNAAIT